MKKLIYSTVAIVAIAGVGYAVADHQAHKVVKAGLDQWIQTQTHKANSQVTAISYGNIDTNGLFFFTHRASIHNIQIKFKALDLKAETKRPQPITNKANLLKFPELNIKTLEFTGTQHAVQDIKLSAMSLSSQDPQTTHYLNEITKALGGQPIATANYHYQTRDKTEAMNITVKVEDQTILSLNEQGKNVPEKYTLPQSWARSFKHSDDNFVHMFKQMHQELIENTGTYTTKLNINLAKLQLPAFASSALKQLGYTESQPLTLKLNGQINSKQKTTTMNFDGYAKLPKAAATHFNNSLTIDNAKIAKDLGELLAQAPKNTATEQQQQALAMHLLAIEGRNIFLDSLMVNYQDNSLLPRIYQENAKHMQTDKGPQLSAQDVATLYAAIVQSAQINPALTPYQTTLAQFFQNPKELKLTIKPEKPLSLFEIFFFATHKQDEALIHALNAKLTNHA